LILLAGSLGEKIKRTKVNGENQKIKSERDGWIWIDEWMMRWAMDDTDEG
jgi:hypothetical protein